MKLKVTTCLILLVLLALAGPIVADGVSREFSLPPDQPKCSGYAEVEYRSQHKGRMLGFSNRVWFEERSRYRVESVMLPGSGQFMRAVRDGDRMYSALVDAKSTQCVRWYTFPSSWLGSDYLDTWLQPHPSLKNARVVETITMHGLTTQHWRGIKPGKSGTAKVDVWISTDPRFPLVLKWQTQSPNSSSNWEMTRLDINSPVPGCAFTPQTNPRPGIGALLAMQFWPSWLVLAWYVAYLACWGAVLFSLSGKGGAGRTITGLIAGLGVMGLLFVTPRSAAYGHVLSGVWLQLAIAALIAGFAACVVRRVGWPGQAPLFKGIKWTVVVYAVIAAVVAAIIVSSRQYMLSSGLGVSTFGLPFLPVTLLNVLVCYSAWAFLEEFIFRGYVYSTLVERLKSLRSVNIIQALLFAVTHIPRDINGLGLSLALPVSFILMFLFGILFGNLRRRYGNIGAPWIVHAAYNITWFYILSVSSLGVIQAAVSGLR